MAMHLLMSNAGMSQSRRVLVATQDPDFACSMVAWLTTTGFELTLVTTFQAAKRQLTLKPALVIADVKLGAYNGLQVAAWARGLGIASIVIGPPDAVLLRDAMDLGATYLEPELAESPFLTTIRSLLGVDDHAPARAHTIGNPPDVATDDDADWPLWREPATLARAAGAPKRPVVH